MLELFSRKPDAITLASDSHLTPIPIDEEISSLSAILLNEEYYQFIHEGKSEIDGLSVISPEFLIPLKARAWLDLSARLDTGTVDEADVKKHKNDIIRLYQLLPGNNRMYLPNTIQQDMQKFLKEVKKNPVDVKIFGLKHTNFNELITNLSQIYGVSLD